MQRLFVRGRMTKRLYYDDAYLTRFTARVIEQTAVEGQPALVLDRTAFYPTSGGQPFDRGVLGGIAVRDVVVRETDGAVLHVLDDHAPGQYEIAGEIDWPRRFDHMQQHSGQHILSQAFAQTAQAETVSFHLGAQSATIDLGSLPAPADMERAELLANEVVWQDRPITTQVIPSTRLDDVPLRKPATVSGDVRVIQVADFDWSACGGTHVARSGEIGLIKIIKWERRGDEMRVEFRCGRRAWEDYHHKNRTVNRLAAGFNVGHWELDQAVKRLEAEAQDLRSRLRGAERALSKYTAAELRASAPSVAGVRLVVHHVPEQAQKNMRELARQLVSEPGVVALLGAGNKDQPGAGKAQFCFARSPDVEVDMVPLVRGATETLGGRGGGGRPEFAQGGGPLADAQQLNAALEWAAQRLGQQLQKTRDE
jgi:alanyl-tRNA synthetase